MYYILQGSTTFTVYMKGLDLESFKCVKEQEKTFQSRLRYFYFFPSGNLAYTVQINRINELEVIHFYECSDFGMGECTQIGTPFSQINSKTLRTMSVSSFPFATEKTKSSEQLHGLCFIVAESGSTTFAYCRICPHDMRGCSSGEDYFEVGPMRGSSYTGLSVSFKNEDTLLVVYSSNSNDMNFRFQKFNDAAFGINYLVNTADFGVVFHCGLDRFNQNKLECQEYRGRVYAIEFSDTEVTSVRYKNHSNPGYAYIKLHYKFSPSKSFSYSFISSNNDSVTGVSLSADPLLSNKEVGLSLTEDESNKPNTSDSRKYFSINEIFDLDSEISVTRDQNGIVTQDEICPSYFAYRGKVKQCLNTCLQDNKIISTGERECKPFCELDQYVLDTDLQNCFNNPCPSHDPVYFYKGSKGSSVCIASCSGDYTYTHEDTCKKKCSPYISISGEPNIDASSGTCTDNCTSGFELIVSEHKYPDETQKVYCSNECNFASFNHYYTENQVNKCVTSCSKRGISNSAPDEFAYLFNNSCLTECPTEAKFITNVVNFNQTGEYGECALTCEESKYQIVGSENKYSITNNQKYYCVEECSSIGLSYFYIDQGIKKCTDRCGNQASTLGIPDKYSYLDGTECKTRCPEDKFISVRENFNSENEHGVCISTCEESDYRIPELEPGQPPLTYNIDGNPIKQYCVSNCTNFGYPLHYLDENLKRCTDKCGNQGSTLGISNSLSYTMGNQCVSACPSTNPILINITDFNSESETGICTPTCSADKFRLEAENLKFSNNQSKTYCFDACNEGNFTKYVVLDNIKYCVDDCRTEISSNNTVQNSRYILLQYPHFKCNSYCPSKYIRDIKEFKTSLESGLCATNCEGDETPLEEAGSIFSNGIQKIYCTPGCSFGPLKKEYHVDANIHCTDSCLAESASVSIPTNIRYHVAEDEKTICKSKCPLEYPFISNPSNFNSLSEHGECLQNCNRFEVNDPKFTYSDGSTKKYCIDSCILVDLKFAFESNGTQKCTDSCLNPSTGNKRYSLANESGVNQCKSKCEGFIANISEFNTESESGKCESKCDNYTLNSAEFKWEDGQNKTYCLSECAEMTDNYPYKTFDRKCVKNCQEAGYKFTSEDKSCSNDCSSFILNSIYCVAECPLDFPLVEDKHCTTECSDANPFIEDYKQCTDKCPNLRYNDICVDKCNDEALISYLTEKNEIYSEQPFISSKGVCSESCSEKQFPFVNSETNECVSSCPPKCDECSFNHLTYTYKDYFCISSCEETDFPLADEVSMKCVSECTSEAPFIFEGKCLQKCPQSHSLVINKPNCENSDCESKCSNFTKLCSDKCGDDFPYQVSSKGEKQCVCKCPEFFKPKGNKCELFCDQNLGFLPDLSGLECMHCFIDSQSFLHEGSCVPSCPLGTAPNKHSVCSSCLSLNLWADEKQRCIPFSSCNKLSYFNYEKKLCTLCQGEDLMIVKDRSKYSCEKTKCEGGFISTQLSRPICVFCQATEFFEDPECTGACKPEMTYDLFNRKCLLCPKTCSCCQNGSCRKNKCDCEPGWVGKYCEIPLAYASEAVEQMLQFITDRLSGNSLKTNENEMIFQVSILYKTQRRLLVELDRKIDRFIDNVFDLIKRQHVKFAFQPSLLSTLDNLLQLALSYSKKTTDTTKLDNLVEFLYQITNQIQIFNVTMNIAADFTIFTKGLFEGIGFELVFGTNVAAEEKLGISTCIGKIKENLGLPLEFKLPYRLVTLKSSMREAEAEKDTFIASKTPFIMMLSIYTQKGPINIEKQCEERFIDVSYTIELEDEAIAQKIKGFSQRKIDVFNKKDPFFNDRCVPFSEGQDITLSKRKETMFVDSSSICNESASQICTVESVDEDGKAKCSCKGIKNKKKSSIESTFSSYPKSNYILVTCVDTFLKAILNENIGFYTVATPCLLAFLLIYYCNWRIDKDLIDERRFQYMRTDICMFEPNSMEKDIYFNECAELEEKLSLIQLEKNIRDSLEEAKIAFDFNSLPTLPDLAALSFEDKARLDVRTNIQFAKDTFLYENTLYYALFSKSTLDPKPFVLLVFVTELNLNIALNCFFIDDNLVDNFNENSNDSVFSSFYEELPKTIWALVTAKTLILVVQFLYSLNQRQANLLKKRLILTKDNSAVKAYNLFLTSHTFRLFTVLIAIFVLNGFCIYFVVIYSEIYSQSTDIWINGILTGLFMDLIVVQGIAPLLLIISRALARKYKRLTFFHRIIANLMTLKGLSAV